MEPEITIVLADDHKLFRDGVRALLEKYKDIKVIGEAENGAVLIELLQHLSPDIILIDLTMPVLSGIDALPQLKQINESVKIVVLTMHEDGDYIRRCVQAGVHAYLFKNVDEEVLISTVRKVAKGERVFNSFVSQLMIESMSRESKSDEVKLTGREKEILSMVAEGLSTKMIADKLFLSARTVETHRVNIMKKFSVHNTAELIRKAAELKLL